MDAMETHALVNLSSGDFEVRCAAESDDDEIWIGSGAFIFSLEDWEKAVKFVERVRTY